MKKITSYIFPETLEEARESLAGTESSRIVAGGTYMILRKDSRIETLVDISRLGLSYIKEEDGFIKIGAATPVARMTESPVLAGYAGGLLKDAARAVANSHLRELITVGGDLGMALPWCDLPPAFLALGGTLIIYDGDEKEIPLSDFYKDRSRHKKQGWIIKEIRVPADKPGIGIFRKISRTKIDYATLDVAVYLEKNGTMITNPGIAIACAVSVPLRIKDAEKILSGKVPDEELFRAAARSARSSARTITNLRGTSSYRSQLIEIYTGRCLIEAWAALSK